jgi:hypothetical protein
MKHGVDLTPADVRDLAAGILRPDGDDIHAPTASLLEDLGRDRQRPVDPGAHDQPASTPRKFLVDGHRRVPELVSVPLEGFFLRFRTRPPSMTMSCSYPPLIDLDGAETE